MIIYMTKYSKIIFVLVLFFLEENKKIKVIAGFAFQVKL